MYCVLNNISQPAPHKILHFWWIIQMPKEFSVQIPQTSSRVRHWPHDAPSPVYFIYLFRTLPERIHHPFKLLTKQDP